VGAEEVDGGAAAARAATRETQKLRLGGLIVLFVLFLLFTMAGAADCGLRYRLGLKGVR